MQNSTTIGTATRDWVKQYIAKSNLDKVSSELKDALKKQHKEVRNGPNLPKLYETRLYAMKDESGTIIWIGHSMERSVKDERTRILALLDQYVQMKTDDPITLSRIVARGFIDLFRTETEDTIRRLRVSKYFITDAISTHDALFRRSLVLNKNGIQAEEPICPSSSYVRIVHN